jgi:hypothetical protein
MRRMAHEALTKKAVQNYHPVQMKESAMLASSLLSSPVSCNRDKHFQRLTASMIMSIVYDYPTLVSEHDQTIDKIEEYISRVSRAATPGAFFVNIFPWMMYIPARSWLSSLP